jgi:hypothetical protein
MFFTVINHNDGSRRQAIFNPLTHRFSADTASLGVAILGGSIEVDIHIEGVGIEYLQNGGGHFAVDHRSTAIPGGEHEDNLGRHRNEGLSHPPANAGVLRDA